MKALRYWTPLLGFVVPTIAIGYGVVIPRSCIAGVNELTIGFATTVLGACITKRSAFAPRSATESDGRRCADPRS